MLQAILEDLGKHLAIHQYSIHFKKSFLCHGLLTKRPAEYRYDLLLKGPPALASARSLLEIETLGPHPGPPKSESALPQGPRE